MTQPAYTHTVLSKTLNKLSLSRFLLSEARSVGLGDAIIGLFFCVSFSFIAVIFLSYRFTVRCYAECSIATASRLSVRLSVILRYRDHIYRLEIFKNNFTVR